MAGLKLLTHDIEIGIRFSEMDPLGVVWHGNYFKFFEDGRDALGARYGLDYFQMHEKYGIVVPMVSCQADFKTPIYYQNRLKVTTTLVSTPAAKIVHQYQIFNLSTNKLCATGKTVQVFLDKQGTLQLNIPEFFVNWKKQNGLD